MLARPNLIDYFRDKFLDLLKTACIQIKKRFSFDDPVLSKQNAECLVAADTRIDYHFIFPVRSVTKARR